MTVTVNKRIIAVVLMAIVGMTMLFIAPQTVDAAGNQGFGFVNTPSITKTSFKMGYYAKKKGTYKADLYKTNKGGSKKVAYIRTITFKCNKKGAGSGYNYRSDYVWFKKASPNTYYVLYPCTKNHNRSMHWKTKK